MENSLADSVVLYKDAQIYRTQISNNSIIGSDAYIADSCIGSYCTIERRNMIFYCSIGDYTYTGYNTVIKHTKIGKFCSVSWNCSIGGAEHHLNAITTHPFPFINKFGLSKNARGGGYNSNQNSLTIGNDVWIAANACITRGVTVADGAVIGAGAVVTHDIPPYEIWAGVPARKKGQRFSDEIISELLDLKWWNASHELLKENIDFFRNDNVSISMIAELKEKIGSVNNNVD